MSKYYKHKPYWARPEDWVTRKPSGAKQAGPRVLEATRSPSGEWAFNGNSYTVPATDERGFRRGRSVPNSRPSGMMDFAKRNLNKQRLAGAINKANTMMMLAEAFPDLYKYSWDDFWEGKAPPPFDWLNVPEHWLPTKTPDTVVPRPPGSIARQNKDGDWFAVQPPVEGHGGHIHWTIPASSWPPPGTGVYPTVGEVKPSVKDLISANWYTVDTNTLPNWNNTTHDFTDSGASPTSAYGLTVYLYPRRIRASGDITGSGIRFQAFKPKGTGIPVPEPVTWADGRFDVTTGQTEEEALNPGEKGRTVMTPLPAPYRFKHPYENLFKELAGARVVDIPVYDPVGEGGTRVIAPPSGPVIVVPTKPGEPPHPPGNGTKERKRLVGGAAFFITQKIFHGITEYQDALDGLFDALPKSVQKGFKGRGPVSKSLYLFQHLDDVDIGDAIVNLAWNQFEDYVIGRGLFGVNKKAAAARGDRYAFRTLNSANGYGGLDTLGEAYGDFSKEYVNPKKEDLKRYLSERFGL